MLQKKKMSGHAKIIFFALTSCLFVTGTLAQGNLEIIEEELPSRTDLWESNKAEEEANFYRRSSDDIEETTLPKEDVARIQAEVLSGTRRRGGYRNATSVNLPDKRRDDASTTTTTTSRTPRECNIDGVRYAEGALVDGAGATCEKCYCFNGEVTCRSSCAPAPEGCKPVLEEGHCCPVKYDCGDSNRRVSVDEFFKDLPVKINTAEHRKELERMRPEWQTNMARKSPGGETIISDTEKEQYQSSDDIPGEEEVSPEEVNEEKKPINSEDKNIQSKKEANLDSTDSEDPSLGEPVGDEPSDQKRTENQQRPVRVVQRKRLSSMITRPSPEEIANRRKQTRYTQRRGPPSTSRSPSQSLSFRLRQRIKLDKEKDKSTSSMPPSTTVLASTTSSTPTSTTVLSSSTSSTSPSTTVATTTTSTSPSTTVATTTTSTSTLLPSEATTKSIQSTSQETTEEYVENEFASTIPEDLEPVTTEYEETTQAYGPVPGIIDTSNANENLKDTSGDVEETSTDLPSFFSRFANLASSRNQLSSFTTTSTTTTTPTTTTKRETIPTTTLTTTEFEDETLPQGIQAEAFGHAGEVFLVEDHSTLKVPKPIDPSMHKMDEVIRVGTGVNVKGDLSNTMAFGPILIHDNRVRTDRQNKDLNATEPEETSDGDNTAATYIPEETTMITIEETDITDDVMANGGTVVDFETGTEEITTLFPVFPEIQETTVKSLSELLSKSTAASSASTTQDATEVLSPEPSTEASFPGEVLDYEDIETSEDFKTNNFDSYDITVGTSVLATNQAKPILKGTGEVISVDLPAEHKTPEVESSPAVEDGGTSLFGTLLNLLTRTERPRMPPPPPRHPFGQPFRPRPVRPGRPEIIPSRFRPPPPPPALERDSTEEPEINTIDASSPVSPIITTERPQIIPTNEASSVINRPVSGFLRPKPIINTPINSRPRPDIPRHPIIPNRPDFISNRPVTAIPQANIPTTDAGLPSKPVIEGGFQGMKDNEGGVNPNIDFVFKGEGRPTLPPSLPNLQIIPFVAADAVVNQEIGTAGAEFEQAPFLSGTGDNNQDEESEATTDDPTTSTTTTTTRRPFRPDRRPAIQPPRRETKRPGLFRRPGERPRPPFAFRTSTAPSTSVENFEDSTSETVERPRPSPRPGVPNFSRERLSTRPPFIPPRRPITTTGEVITTTTTRSPPPITTTSRRPLPITTTSRRPLPIATTPRPIESDDIANLLLQDVFGLTGGQNPQPVRFTPDRTTPKNIIPVKFSPVLPDIPAAVRDQLPLATDPFLASGLLKLSGCNIYGRMYGVGAQIKELSGGCKECRCTPVGVQCLPIC